MWAYALTAPGRLERLEAPEPVPADGEVLVRLRAGGICGSDLPSFRGRRSSFVDAHGEPGFPLHEAVGEVISGALPAGARVVGWPKRHLGLAELFVSRVEEIIVLGDDTLGDVEATVIQPLATVLYAVDRLGDVRGRRAAVLGLGPIGLLFTHALATRGAHVTGIDRVDRRDVASAFGMEAAIWGDASTLETDAFDVVVEAVGHQTGTLQDAIAALSLHGTLLAFGVPDDAQYPFPFTSFFRKGATLITGPASERAASLEAAREYLASAPELLGPYITHVHDVHRAQEAFERAIAPAAGQLKIVLKV